MVMKLDNGIHKGTIILIYNNLRKRHRYPDFFGPYKIEIHEAKILHFTCQLLKIV